jgi:hypothetical protein
MLVQALELLLRDDMRPRLNPMAQQDSNQFREKYCYTRETDAVLLKHARR